MIRAAIPAAVAAALLVTGCRRDMFDQPKFRPLAPSDFYADGRSARPIPAGTFTIDANDAGDAVDRGLTNGVFVATIPVPVNEAMLRRGQDRFDIYCSPCHGRIGDGRGMVARRGFWQPADLHSDRVRNAPPGYIFGVVSNGFGAMPQYADQLSVADRWAVVAYIRALELSRRATPADVPPEGLTKLENGR